MFVSCVHPVAVLLSYHDQVHYLSQGGARYTSC